MADPREAFARALHEGHEREHNQRWQDAVDTYTKLLASLRPTKDPESRAMRALALLRSGNALLALRRWEDARGALDEAVRAANGSGAPATVPQSLLAAGVL